MSAVTPPLESLVGWRYPRTQPSLPESYRSVSVPKGVSFWRKALAFAGPGYMVAVGYMDPGNWATDLAGGFHHRRTQWLVTGRDVQKLDVVPPGRRISRERSHV